MKTSMVNVTTGKADCLCDTREHWSFIIFRFKYSEKNGDEKVVKEGEEETVATEAKTSEDAVEK